MFGGHSVLVPPLPIPNRAVKRDRADDSVDSHAKVGHRQTPFPTPLCQHTRVFLFVRPAGRTHLEVEVLYSPGKGRRGYWIKIEARVVDASTDIPHGIRYSLTLL